MTREEIDEAIMRHADMEMLYDQPYEDRNRIRVTGPFTVESLSRTALRHPIQNSLKQRRWSKIKFDSLESFTS